MVPTHEPDADRRIQVLEDRPALRPEDRLFNPATVAAPFGYVAIGTSAVAETPVDTALGTEAASATPRKPLDC